MNNTFIQPIFYLLQAEAAEHAEHSVSFMDQLIHSNILNFVLAALFLFWVFKKFNVLSALDKRQQQIVKDLQDAEAKRAQALKDLDELEKRSARLAGEVDTILKEAEETAEMVGKSIIANAEEEAEKTLVNARKRIAQEQQTAARELEQRLMREAVHGARQLLENTLTDEDRLRSVQDFVNELPELYQKEVAR